MFDLSNYEQVKDRITRFYGDHKDGRIITELASDPTTLAKEAAFKASVYIGDTLKATGYAYEAQGQGVNRDAWVENAETSAIGRALANMDYCGTLRPSREEMSKVKIVHAEIEPKMSEEDKEIGGIIKGLLADLDPDGTQGLRAKMLKEYGRDYAMIARKLEEMQIDLPPAAKIVKKVFGKVEEEIF